MTELQAAVARAQLPKLASVVEDRRLRAAQLTKIIENLAGLHTASDGGGTA